MDPSYPDARLQFMVKDSSPALLLTHSRYAQRLMSLTTEQTIPALALDDAHVQQQCASKQVTIYRQRLAVRRSPM